MAVTLLINFLSLFLHAQIMSSSILELDGGGSVNPEQARTSSKTSNCTNGIIAPNQQNLGPQEPVARQQQHLNHNDNWTLIIISSF